MEYKGFTYTLTPKTAWDSLSMLEKSEMMKVAVRNGITGLKTIREKYNEFAKGGYLDWKEKANKYKHLDIDNDRTYDYEGWYNENPQRAWDFLNDNPDAHFDDKYKTVYHPTFSTQSKYSGKKDATYNPLGLVGGTWNKQGTVFTMSPDGYRGPVSMDKRKWYLENAEDNGVQLREADGSLPLFDGIPWGGVLPSVTVTSNKFAMGGDKDKNTPRPVTTGGAGYIPDTRGIVEGIKNAALNYAFGDIPKSVIRRRLYDNIQPYSYGNALYRIHNAVVNNKKEKNKDYIEDQRDDIFAEYLQIPKEQRHNTGTNYWKLQPAKYKPSLGENNTNYFSLSLPEIYLNDLYNDVYFGTHVRNSDGLNINENTVAETIDPLGRHTIGRGYDSKGEYMSYYDLWDLTPYGQSFKDQSFGIGKPVNIYDRIYLDDYFGVSEPTHSTYLPEVIVYGNKKAEGGPIHIAPSKKGTFTAAAKKHGKSVQAFASQVLAHPENYSSAMRKKANFARNFGGKKKSYGGYMEGGIYDIDIEELNRLISNGYEIELL